MPKTTKTTLIPVRQVVTDRVLMQAKADIDRVAREAKAVVERAEKDGAHPMDIAAALAADQAFQDAQLRFAMLQSLAMSGGLVQ